MTNNLPTNNLDAEPTAEMPHLLDDVLAAAASVAIEEARKEMRIVEAAENVGGVAITETMSEVETEEDGPHDEVVVSIEVSEEIFDEPEVLLTDIVPKSRARPNSGKKRPTVRGKANSETGGINSDDPIKDYLTSIGNYEVLTKDQEIALAKAVEAGAEARAIKEDEEKFVNLNDAEKRQLQRQIKRGKDAHDLFVKHNLKLVVSVAKKYTSSGVPLLDLVQEGNLGLMHAVGKFDWRKGFKFSTYATWWIRQAVTRSIDNDSRTIRVPVHASEELRIIKNAERDFQNEHGRLPTTEELIIKAEMPYDKVVNLTQISRDPVSLDQTVNAEGFSDSKIGDFVEDANTSTAIEDVVRQTATKKAIDDSLEILDERERKILKLRYALNGGQPMTLEEVGKEIGLTRERVRQLEARAFSKIKHPSNDAEPHTLLEDL